MPNRVPIIYYHEVVSKRQGYSYQRIEVERFEDQMRWLRDNGYRGLLFSEVQEAAHEGSLPRRPVIVSFDDGFRSVYENAAPVMRRYGIKGNVYLPTAFIGADDHFMTWEMVRELQGTGAWEFHAHTHMHADVRGLSFDELRAEMSASDALFTEHLGECPQVFCLPFGTYDRRSLAALRRLNRYQLVLGSAYGFANLARPGHAPLPRIGISNDDSLAAFAAKLAGRKNWKGPLQRARLHARNLRGERITEYVY